MHHREYREEMTGLVTRIQAYEAEVVSVGQSAHGAPLKRLEKLWMFYRYLVDRGVINGAPWGVQILYAKISNCIISIFHELRHGYPGPAAMVMRSLFESAIHLDLILEKDSEQRAKLFVDFQYVEGRTTFSMGCLPPEAQKEIARAYEAAKGNYRPKKPRSWCWQIVKSERKDGKGVAFDPTLRDICKHLGLLDLYERLYGKLSASIHPVPSYGAIINRASGDLVLELGPHFTDMTKSLGDFASVIAVQSLLDVIQLQKPDDMIELSSFIRVQTGFPLSGDS